MSPNDAKALISFRAEHPKDDPATCYNRWTFTLSHRLSIQEAKEAYFICTLPPSDKLATMIKEDRL